MRPPAGHSEGHVACAARHVENLLARAGLYASDETILPQPVHAAGHEIVHHVVSARDGAEDLPNAPRLLFGADDLVAEIHLLGHRAAPLAGLAAVRHIG